MTTRAEKRKASVDLWESGQRGAEKAYAKRVGKEEEEALDAALELQMISIRLPKKLIEQLKLIASINGIGYQPLIRDVVSRFARNELHEILRQKVEMEKLEQGMRRKPAAPTPRRKAA